MFVDKIECSEVKYPCSNHESKVLICNELLNNKLKHSHPLPPPSHTHTQTHTSTIALLRKLIFIKNIQLSVHYQISMLYKALGGIEHWTVKT